MTELLVATGNQGKLKEIRHLLSDLPFRVTSLADYKNLPPIVEDGTTFRANAVKKAMTISRITGKLVLGEDSGLEVDALDGRPGVWSARYSGPNASDASNNRKLMKELKDIPDGKRTARYHCCAALSRGDRLVSVVNGTCEGLITRRARGENGFGYDPYFLIESYQKTFGQLPPSIKAEISHRAKALQKIKRSLQKFLEAHR